MKISLPFIYQVDFKKPRQARYESADIVCREEVEIVEIDPDYAPVVHVVSDTSAPFKEGYNNTPKTASKFHVPDGNCVIRLVDGQYYASRFPVSEIEQWRGNDEFDPFSAVVALKHGESEFRNAWSASMAGDRSGKSKRLNDFHADNPGAKKFSSDRMIAERNLVAFAKRFASVDGVLYEKVREPVLSVVVGSPVQIVVEESITPALDRFFKGTWRGAASGRIRFGLDEYERAFETANALASASGVSVEAHASVTSVDPDVVRFRGDHEYLFVAAKNAVSQFRKAVEFMPERTGVAVMAAANLLAVHDRLTPASLAAVRRMQAELADYFANHRHPHLSSSRYADGAWQVWSAFGDDWQQRSDRLSHAISHWDGRDDVGMEWLDGALDALPLYDYPRRAIEITSQMDLDKLEMRWKGAFPRELFRVDPASEVIVVVEDFEMRLPFAAMVFDRSNLAAAPAVYSSGDLADVSQDVSLASAYVSTAKEAPSASLRRVMETFAPS